MNEQNQNEQIDQKKTIAFNPAIAGAAGIVTSALIEVPVFAQTAPTTTPVQDMTTQVGTLSGVATAAAAVAGIPIVIYFGYRIIKRVLAGGT